MSSPLQHSLQIQLTILVLSSIAFQYYPLDYNSTSNPFIVSWWPRALADPALFHVSLQTASLDEELRAQKGFPISQLLMVDSVSLVRQRIEDPTLAFQDETLNSVVTLAAIEVKSSSRVLGGLFALLTILGTSTAKETSRLAECISTVSNAWLMSGAVSPMSSAQGRLRQEWFRGKIHGSSEWESADHFPTSGFLCWSQELRNSTLKMNLASETEFPRYRSGSGELIRLVTRERLMTLPWTLH